MVNSRETNRSVTNHFDRYAVIVLRPDVLGEMMKYFKTFQSLVVEIDLQKSKTGSAGQYFDCQIRFFFKRKQQDPMPALKDLWNSHIH